MRLVADTQILILDEKTASVDSFVKAQIQDALRVLQKGRTSILIAHRLATVKDADRIVVLRHGAILKQGLPAELLVHGGFMRTGIAEILLVRRGCLWGKAAQHHLRRQTRIEA